MARQASTPQAVFTIPGAYASYTVQANPSGLATSGVLVLIGEAEEGPAFSQEAAISATFFGPSQISSIAAKYGSGNLVTAARIASQAANDPNIQGSPSGFYLFKTNVSGKASRSAPRTGLSAYGTLYDKSYGLPGNLISTEITENPSEVAPAVTFTYIPVPGLGSGNSTLGFRVNGGVAETLVIAKQSTVPTVVGSIVHSSSSGLNSLAGILATGGQDQTVLSGFTAGVDTLAVVASGNQVVITGTQAWGNTPQAGDTLVIPGNATFGAGQDSAIAGAGSANLGLYIVVSATALTVTATKLRDAAALTVTPPVNVSAVAIDTDKTDVLVYAPVSVQNVTGTSRPIFVAGNVGETVTGAAVGQVLTLTLGSGSWNAEPQVNDLIEIPTTAPSAWHASGANGGWYKVTASTAQSVTMTRLSNGAPSSFSATAIGATTDLVCLRPAIDGVGKTLEIYDGSNTVNVSKSLFTAAGNAVSFLSTLIAPTRVVSSAELSVDVTAAQNTYSEDVDAGGSIGLQIGYAGTSCSAVVTAKTLTITPVGGVGGALSITLKQYPSIGSLASFINSQPGYTASAGNNLIAQKPLMTSYVNASGNTVSQTILDQGTYTVGSQFGALTGRIKFDAYDFWNTLKTTSQLVQIGNPSAPAAAGLPEAEDLAFLSGGSLGSTTDSNVVAALAKAESARLNFVVPLFSDDATNDAVNDLTDAGSTYTIAAINANTKTHVLKMSTITRRRARQAWCSFNGSFTDAQAAAADMASYRVAMCFENFMAQASDGSLQLFQPWSGSVYAAAMQAAGFYKSILAKVINTSGVSPVDSSFDPDNDDQLTIALEAGLLPARALESGGYAWSSDQTTYAVDNNFVFNSTQTVYAADLVSLTTAQRMERALVGQSLADVSASSGLGIFSSIMVDMKRLKLIASSDDAPAGYKNVTINVIGDTMFVSAEIKVTTTLAFVPINFTVSEIQQAAAA